MHVTFLNFLYSLVFQCSTLSCLNVTELLLIMFGSPACIVV